MYAAMKVTQNILAGILHSEIKNSVFNELQKLKFPNFTSYFCFVSNNQRNFISLCTLIQNLSISDKYFTKCLKNVDYNSLFYCQRVIICTFFIRVFG